MKTATENTPDEFMISMAKDLGKDPATVKCWHCLDGDAYPQYGRAPHKSFLEGLSLTNQLPQSEWPADFEPDWVGFEEEKKEGYDGPMCGTWYCPKDCEFGGITALGASK